MYSLYQAKEITKKVSSNTINWITKNGCYTYEFKKTVKLLVTLD